MPAINKSILIIFAAIILAFAIFVWPTPYRYERGTGEYRNKSVMLIRINRITGNVSILTQRGWNEVYGGWIDNFFYKPPAEEIRWEAPAPAPAAPPDPAPYR